MKVTQALGANWSTLLEELLGLILARLDLMDHFRFCSVCKQWRSVATESSALNKPIGLVLIDDPQCLIRQGLTMSGTSWHWTRIVGGFEGLLVLNKGWELILLNPAFGDTPILVPPLNCISGIECADVEKVTLSSNLDHLLVSAPLFSKTLLVGGFSACRETLLGRCFIRAEYGTSLSTGIGCTPLIVGRGENF